MVQHGEAQDITISEEIITFTKAEEDIIDCPSDFLSCWLNQADPITNIFLFWGKVPLWKG